MTAALPARAQDRLNLVATFSILGDFARNVGGERVSVTTLVGPNGDVHVYTPAPADAKKIADAKLVIINGLGLEGWLSRLVQSAGSKATMITASQGITPRKLGADADPHAWQSVGNARIYVVNIRDALVAADPAGAGIYRANADRYLANLDALDRDVRAAVAQIPEGRRKVISTHDAFGYFAMMPSAISRPPMASNSSRRRAFPPNPKRAHATLPRSSPRSKPRKSRRFFLKILAIRG